jgi:hypothetical protein
MGTSSRTASFGVVPGPAPLVFLAYWRELGYSHQGFLRPLLVPCAHRQVIALPAALARPLVELTLDEAPCVLAKKCHALVKLVA